MAKSQSEKTTPQTTPSKKPMLISLVLGSLLIGIVLGMTFTARSPSMTDAEFSSKIEAYLKTNAGTVITAVNNHIENQANAEQQQAINLASTHDEKTILGNPDGDVTIYEFSDYNCGYCKRAFNDVMAAVREDGNIRLVIKEFPILAQSSVTAAQLSIAAAEMGRFEDVHTALMKWQGRLDDEAFMQIITELGIDMTELDRIIAEGRIDTVIEENHELARRLQISGTPGFIIGNEIIPGYIPKETILEFVRKTRAG